jgi:hypothetical protein
VQNTEKSLECLKYEAPKVDKRKLVPQNFTIINRKSANIRTFSEGNRQSFFEIKLLILP